MDTWSSHRWAGTDGSIRSNEVRHAHAKPQALPQGANHRQVEEAGEEGPHPRVREEGHGVDTEPQESRLQQDLPEDHVQHLGPVQINKKPALGFPKNHVAVE